MPALLLLHLWKGGGDAVENSFDIDVDLPFPFLDLEGLDRRDGHDAGVIHDDVDTVETVDCSLDECVHLSVFRNVDGKPDSLTACDSNLFHDGVDPLLLRKSE